MSSIKGLQIENVVVIETGRLLAQVSVRLGWLTIEDFRVVRLDNGSLAVSHPKILLEGADGRPSYKNVLGMDSERKAALNVCILAAYNDAVKDAQR